MTRIHALFSSDHDQVQFYADDTLASYCCCWWCWCCLTTPVIIMSCWSESWARCPCPSQLDKLADR